MLVRPHHDHASRLAVDPPQLEYVVGIRVRAEHLLVVDEAEPALPRQENTGHLLNIELTVSLLEDGPNIND